MMFFVKYIGIVAFPLVIYLIYMGERKRRVKNIIIASLLILIPSSLWILRNLVVADSPFGRRGGSIYNLFDVTLISTETLLYWVFPVLFLVPILFILVAKVLRKIDVSLKELIKRTDIALIFTILFVGATLLSSSISAFDRLNNRLLFPVFIPLLIIFLMTLEKIKDNFTKFDYKRILIISGFLLMIIPIGVYIRTDIKSFTLRLKNGAGGIATDEYQARLPKLSAQSIEQIKSENNIYSNNPELLYYASGIQSQKAPGKYYYNSADVEVSPTEVTNFFRGGDSYLIWVGESSNGLSYSPEELQKYVTIKLIESGPNYKLYLISGRK
jgi:hypothetical protein